MGRQWRRSWEETLSRFVHLPEPRISHLYTAPTPPEPQGTEWQRPWGAYKVPCMVYSQGTGKCRCCCHPAAAGNGLLFSASFSPQGHPGYPAHQLKGLCPGASSERSHFDSDLQLAMELSAKELEEWELGLREEEEELQQVLQLSLTEK